MDKIFGEVDAVVAGEAVVDTKLEDVQHHESKDLVQRKSSGARDERGDV